MAEAVAFSPIAKTKAAWLAAIAVEISATSAAVAAVANSASKSASVAANASVAVVLDACAVAKAASKAV